MELLKRQFMVNTIEPCLFQIEDVNTNNACLYKSLANCLHYRSVDLDSLPTLNENDKTNENSYKDVFEDQEWGYDGEKQEQFARIIQDKSYQWLLENKDDYYNTELGMSYADLIEDTHNLTMSEYEDLYSNYAGDKIKIPMSTNKLDSDGNEIVKMVFMENRWGGSPELMAISKICKMPIIIYGSQKFCNYRNKIILGRIRGEKAEKGVRFKPLKVIGQEYIDEKNSRPPMFLLWKNSKHGAHYMSLYLKNKKSKVNKNGFIISGFQKLNKTD